MGARELKSRRSLVEVACRSEGYEWKEGEDVGFEPRRCGSQALSTKPSRNRRSREPNPNNLHWNGRNYWLNEAYW